MLADSGLAVVRGLLLLGFVWPEPTSYSGRLLLRLGERCGYPGDEADASSECKVLVIPGVPWWRSATSGTKRRFFMLASRVWWWWRWFSSATLLRPAVAARGVVVWRVGVLGGWPGRCGGDGKMGGLWKQVLWLCAFIELGVRRVAAAGSAVYYNMWRCFLPREWRYGVSGGD